MDASLQAGVAAFYINLDARLDRRAYMETQLAALGVAAERLPAITPDRIAPEQLAKVAHEGGPTPTELACNLSHRAIWQIVLDRGLAGALVLEDDGVLSGQLGAAVADVAKLGAEIDLVQFESHRTDTLLGRAIATSLPGITRRRLMASSLGTCAYYISAALCRTLLARTDLDRFTADRLLFGRDGGTIYRARVYQVVPALAVQLGFEVPSDSSVARSDLTPQRRAAARPDGQLRRRLRRALYALGHNLRIIATFGPSGDLFGARQMRLPLHRDIASSTQG